MRLDVSLGRCCGRSLKSEQNLATAAPEVDLQIAAERYARERQTTTPTRRRPSAELRLSGSQGDWEWNSGWTEDDPELSQDRDDDLSNMSRAAACGDEGGLMCVLDSWSARCL